MYLGLCCELIPVVLQLGSVEHAEEKLTQVQDQLNSCAEHAQAVREEVSEEVSSLQQQYEETVFEAVKWKTSSKHAQAELTEMEQRMSEIEYGHRDQQLASSIEMLHLENEYDDALTEAVEWRSKLENSAAKLEFQESRAEDFQKQADELKSKLVKSHVQLNVVGNRADDCKQEYREDQRAASEEISYLEVEYEDALTEAAELADEVGKCSTNLQHTEKELEQLGKIHSTTLQEMAQLQQDYQAAQAEAAELNRKLEETETKYDRLRDSSDESAKQHSIAQASS